MTAENFVEGDFNAHLKWKETGRNPQRNIGKDNTYRLTGRKLNDFASSTAGDAAAFALSGGSKRKQAQKFIGTRKAK